MILDKRLLRLLMSERGYLSGIGALSLVSAVFVVGQARLLSSLLDAVFLQGADLARVLPLLSGLFLIGLGRALASGGMEILAGWMAVGIKEKLRLRLVKGIFSAGPAPFQRENSGEISNTITNGIESLDAYYSQYLPQLAVAALIPFAILISVFPLDWLSGVVFLLTAPLIPFFMVLIGKGSEAVTRRQWQSLSRMSAFFLDTLQGLRELKQWNRSLDHAERLARVTDEYRSTTMNVLRITFISALVLELVATISTAVVAVQIGLRLLYGMMNFEQAFLILLLAPEFYQPMRLLGQRFHAGMSGITAAGRIFKLPMLQSEEHEKRGGSPLLFKAGDVIRFENVTFRYPDREEQALKGIDFEWKFGETVALVGSSGSGKTTIARLVMGFIQPNEGVVRISQYSLTEIDLEVWRSQIAWVGQRPYIMNASLLENLRFAKPQCSSGEIQQALRLANLEEVVARLPQGLETPIGEAGAKLSSGELQRVSLARAFLRDAPIVVLDEPTAHLDAGLEEMLESSLERLCRNKTVMIIAHRLPTVMRADQILVLRDGQIVERGRHWELLNNQGFYAQLVLGYGG